MTKDVLFYKSPATCFEEALPIGNGSLGGMVYGDLASDKISLNHDTLSSGTPKRTVRPSAYNAYIKARELVLKGGKENKAEAEYLMKENVQADWTQNYLPMGNLYIKSNKKDAENYVRSLDMKNAVVSVEYGKSKREYLASNPDDCIVAKFEEENPTDYEFSVDSVLRFSTEAKDDFLVLEGECPSNLFPCDRYAEKPCSYDGDSVTFTTVVKVKTDGVISAEDGKLSVKNATKTVIYICTETSFIDYNTLPTKETHNACLEKMEKLFEKDFEDIKERHTEDFRKLFERTDIDFKTVENDIPTDEMLRSGKHYACLAEKMFSFGKYLMISSSRPGSQVTNLQGIWNEDFRPPWCSNYTLNINTQMNYWPALGADLAELQTPLTDFVKKLSDTGTTTAREYYKAPGYVAHHCTDLWGMSTPCGPKAEKSCCWAFWNMSSGWLLQNLFERYEYTLDKEYLEKDVYPLMRGAVEFYKYMVIEDNGKLIMSPSTSPENNYIIDGEKFGLAKYTAMTQQILTGLFTNYVKCCDILGIDDVLKEEAKAMIAKFDTFEVGSRGQLLEWDKEYEENDEQHRHVSHLYGVYPAGLFTNETRKDLYDASRKSLEIRGDDGTGWSISWKISLWAMFKEGNHSFDVFKNQLYPVETNANKEYQDEIVGVATQGVRGGTYINLFDAHPPFQIDGNFGAAAAIMLWLLQCEDGRIKILPALPDELSRGSARGLMAKGNIKLNIEWKDGKCVGLTAVSPVSQTVVFEVNGEKKTVEIEANKQTTAI